MENLNFWWGIWLPSSSLSSIIYYLLGLCDKALLLVPTCLCNVNLPSQFATLPFSGDTVFTSCTTKGPKHTHSIWGETGYKLNEVYGFVGILR